MEQTIEQKNKALVLEAFDTLFNRKDFAAAEKFWSPNYIQHSAHIPPGRNGLFDLVRSAPATMKYENHLIMAEGDMLMLHGRFSGHGAPANWIVLDIVRLQDGRLAEHWDVIEEGLRARRRSAACRCLAIVFPTSDECDGDPSVKRGNSHIHPQ
jgi:predicted SnoaL-like aldol condensation-catalyzing enzyme